MQSTASTNSDLDTNISLIYEDANKSLMIARDDANSFNLRLGVLAGFNVLLITSRPYSYLFIVCITLSLASCFWGLFTRGVTVLVYPQAQVEEISGATVRDFMLAIIEVRDNSIKQFLELIDIKAKRFKISLVLFALAAISKMLA